MRKEKGKSRKGKKSLKEESPLTGTHISSRGPQRARKKKKGFDGFSVVYMMFGKNYGKESDGLHITFKVKNVFGPKLSRNV